MFALGAKRFGLGSYMSGYALYMAWQGFKKLLGAYMMLLVMRVPASAV